MRCWEYLLLGRRKLRSTCHRAKVVNCDATITSTFAITLKCGVAIAAPSVGFTTNLVILAM